MLTVEPALKKNSHGVHRPFSYSIKGLNDALFSYTLYLRFDQVLLELLSMLCTFKNCTKHQQKLLYDSDSFWNS